MVEYAIALFNGNGVAKNEAAAPDFRERAARHGNPIAQNRLAHILLAGRGMPANPIEAVQWHIIAKAGGTSDPVLDDFVGKQTGGSRRRRAAAKPWLTTAALSR